MYRRSASGRAAASAVAAATSMVGKPTGQAPDPYRLPEDGPVLANGEVGAAAVDVYDLHQEDESTVLWGPKDSPLNSEEPQSLFGGQFGEARKASNAAALADDAVSFWLKLGMDPVLDAVLSQPLPGGGGNNDSNGNSISRADAVLQRDDVHGTNLLLGDVSPERAAESRKYWQETFEKEFATRIRYANSNGSAANSIGTPEMVATADAAEKPEATWAQDSEFSRLAKLSAEYLGKASVANREEIEIALRQSDPESFAKYLSALGATDTLCLPIAATSAVVYEGEELEEWAKRFQEARLASADLLKAAAALDGEKWKVVAKSLGEIAAKISAIRTARLSRQEKAGTISPWNQADANTKLAQAYYQCELMYKSIVEAELDPEDSNDTSEDWIKENEEIGKLVASPVNGLGGDSPVTFGDFWKATIRLQGLEMEHLLKDHDSRVVAAQCRVRAFDEAVKNGSHISQALTDEFAGGFSSSRFDSGSQYLIPGMTANWLKINWFAFGCSNNFHHTATSLRKMFFNNDSLHTTLISAQTFYNLRPLSNAVNYATPFEYRRSLARVAADLGLAKKAQDQDRLLSGANKLARAQRLVREVTQSVMEEQGVKRRTQVAAEIEKFNNNSPDAKLVDLKVAFPAGGEAKLGAGVTVSFEIPASIASGFEMPEKSFADPAAAQAYGLEVVLMKKKVQESDKSANPVPSSPTLDKVKQLVADRVALPQSSSTSSSIKMDDDFEFATILTDNLSADRVFQDTVDNTGLTDKKIAKFDLALPRVGIDGQSLLLSASSAAEFKVRVRLFEQSKNPTHIPKVCREAITAETFTLRDSLMDDEAGFFGVKSATELPDRFPGELLISYFAHLRTKGYEIPLELEQEAGQILSPKGEALRSYIHELLAKPNSSGKIQADEDFTTPQLEIGTAVRQATAIAYPGLSAEEWYCRRRWWLKDAMEGVDADWWREVSTSNRNSLSELWLSTADIDLRKMEKRIRAANDKIQVLNAEGTAFIDGGERSGSIDSPAITCAVAGDGSLESFEIDQTVLEEQKRSSGSDSSGVGVSSDMTKILDLCRTALSNGHKNMNALASTKNGDLEKSLIASQLVAPGAGVVNGNKYSRTFLYAYDKVIEELGGGRRNSSSSSSTYDEEDIARLERSKPVDRMPSKEDPTLRRKKFGFQLTSQKAYAEHMPPEHKTNWKQ